MNKLRKLFRLHFIPHKGNAYQPYFLRAKAAAGIFAFILFVEAVYLGNIFLVFPKSDYFAAIFATVLVNETNAKRLEGDLGMLTPNPILEKAAQMKADDMAAKGYFAHVTPDGKTPWYWFDQAGYKYLAAGENLAVNFTDSSDVTNAWMQSPTHRANIMNGTYTEIGIATAEGVYKGRNAIFVVEEFGRPTPSIPQAVTAAPSPVVPKTVAASPKPLAQTKPIVKQFPVSTTSTRVVAGAETVVAPVDNTIPPAETVTPSLSVTQTATPLASFVTAPRHLTTMFYLLLAAILTLALALAVFIEIRIQHARIIWNGVLLIAFIGALIALNTALGIGTGTVIGA